MRSLFLVGLLKQLICCPQALALRNNRVSGEAKSLRGQLFGSWVPLGPTAIYTWLCRCGLRIPFLQDTAP